ncbi:MAG: FUSC family protein [Geminicoccaceae bacterium]
MSESGDRRLGHRLRADGYLGVRYATLIFVAATILWAILELGANTNPVWAISSMVAIVDPRLKTALSTFQGRIVNTLIGCGMGLAFLAIETDSQWKLPVALATTVLVSSYLLHVESSWRMAPTNAAFVVATELTHHSAVGAMEAGLKRSGEVLLGCLVGLAVSWLFAKLWPMREKA